MTTELQLIASLIALISMVGTAVIVYKMNVLLRQYEELIRKYND